ncbi:FtsW/RodA/SpoVE family cell cycle protein [Oceanithermus sp.]
MDRILILAQLLLAGFSILGIVAGKPDLLGRHLATLAVAFAGTLAAALVPPTAWIRNARWLYVLGLVTLVAVLIVGRGPEDQENVRRWFQFQIRSLQFSVQPSEFMKIILVVYLASFFSRRGTDYPIIGPVVSIGLAAGLIAIEPDLGTALFLLFLAAFILIVIGVPFRRLIAIGLLVTLIVASIHGVFLNKFEYITDRVDAWRVMNLDPTLLERWEPDHAKRIRDAIYQPERARLVLRAAGPLGHGPSAELPTNLPERQNDMIFAVITYAGGWIGAGMLLLAYGLVFARGMQIATRSTGALSMLALGLTGYLTGQALMNIVVTMAIVPVTGISLPMVSAGGSGLLAAGLAFGILHATARHAGLLEEVAS